MLDKEKWTVSTHSDNLDAERIKRVITMNDDSYHHHGWIQCYSDSVTINASAGGVQASIIYQAEVMDAICEEWQRFRRELAAHEAQKPQEVKSKEA